MFLKTINRKGRKDSKQKA